MIIPLIIHKVMLTVVIIIVFVLYIEEIIKEWKIMAIENYNDSRYITGIELGKDLKTELEEIKAEIEAEIEKEFYLPDIVAEQNIRAGYLGALAIIDKHINQADCNNDCEHCEWTECPKDIRR